MANDPQSTGSIVPSEPQWPAAEDWPFASVIIPVYNDVKGLSRCLSALDAQTYPEDRYEVIAVDNNSTEPIEPVLDQCDQARGAFERTQGSYAARNRGLEVARGEVVAFTDADCMPEPDWIENGVRVLRQMGGRGVVGGKVEFCFQDPDHPQPFELVETSLFLNQEASVQRRHFAVTANMFTTRSVVADLGSFDPHLQSGGDREWGQRAHQAGIEIRHAPDARVQHATRESKEALYSKIQRVTKGQHDLRSETRNPWAALLLEIFDLALLPVRTIGRLLTNQETSLSVRLQAVGLLLCTRLWQIMIKMRLFLGNT